MSYDYYTGATAGGNAGDLRSMTTPSVMGTPNANDYPNGKTTLYTYSTGFADERLNSNLLTITDPRGLLWLQNTYGSNAVEFDRVTRQVLGAGQIIDMVYVPNPPEPGTVMQVITNDRRGLVMHHYYDAGNRLVVQREFTGLANPAVPTTAASNLPVNPLRSTDPLFFETRYEWNADSCLTRTIHPNGNLTDRIYELALDPMALRHARGKSEIDNPGTQCDGGRRSRGFSRTRRGSDQDPQT